VIDSICMQSEPSLDLSDLSQDFRSADILGVPQAIKGFDKPDFCEVSQYICNWRIFIFLASDLTFL